MKKLMAFLLACCMLFGYAAYAEETVAEQVFLQGASKLLNSINLLRDMMRFDVNYLGKDVFSALVKGGENLVDASVSAEDFQLQAQASETDVSVKSDGLILNLQYADVETLLNTQALSMAPNMEIYGELAALLLQTVIVPDTTVDAENGLRIAYRATPEQLLEHFAAYIDLVAADERYSAAADELLRMIAVAVKGEKPSLSDVKAEIERALEQVKASETDFAVAFDLNANADFTNIHVTGEIGDSSDQFAMEWTYRNEGDNHKLDGLLWENKVLGEKTKKYEITVSAFCWGNSDHNSWSFSFSYPTMGIQLNASGRTEGSMGSIYVNYSGTYSRSGRFLLQLDYALGEDGLIASGYCNPGGMGMYYANLMSSGKQFDLSVRSSAGQTLLLLKLLAEDGQLKYGYMEYSPFNMYQNRLGDNKTTMEFDGEKLVIKANSITVTCTGAFASDHEYVITLHAEGESVRPEEDTAYIRLGYDGEEGNFSLYCKSYGPNEETPSFSAVFSCVPTVGIAALLRDDPAAIRLTPETLLTMLAQ